MKHLNVKTSLLASLLFAGFVMNSCKGNDANTEGSASESEMTDESAVDSSQSMGREEDSMNGRGSGTVADSTAMNGRNNAGDAESESGAGAQPTVPGGTSTGSGNGGTPAERP